MNDFEVAQFGQRLFPSGLDLGDGPAALFQVEVYGRERMMRSSEDWEPLPHQVPPEGSWLGWVMLAGRGAGKTDTCAAYVDRHARGKPCVGGREPHRIAIVGPTQGDAVEACVTGPSGLQAHDPAVRLMPSSPEGTLVRWPNGSRAKIFGAASRDDIERLRAGGNTCLVWHEELAAMRWMDAAFDQALFGLRLGPDPRWLASTTPKPRTLIKQLATGFAFRGEWTVPFAGGQVVVRHATTEDNPHLPAHIRASLFERYGGRAIGQQELYGRVIDQDEGALWRREQLAEHRLHANPDEVRRTLSRLTVGVDPSGGAGEQGIIVAGRRDELAQNRRIGHGFVLDDRTCLLHPEGWGRRAVEAAVDWEADDIVVETNFGGDMAVATIRTQAEQLGVPIPVRQVRASRGKRPRAEPVSALTPSGRWHHVGVFAELEDQLCTWTPEADYSPDRLDAMVWGAWHTRLVGTAAVGGGSLGSLAGHRVPQGQDRRTSGSVLGQPIAGAR